MGAAPKLDFSTLHSFLHVFTDFSATLVHGTDLKSSPGIFSRLNSKVKWILKVNRCVNMVSISLCTRSARSVACSCRVSMFKFRGESVRAVPPHCTAVNSRPIARVKGHPRVDVTSSIKVALGAVFVVDEREGESFQLASSLGSGVPRV